MKLFLICCLSFFLCTTLVAQNEPGIEGKILPPRNGANSSFSTPPEAVRNILLKLVTADGPSVATSTSDDKGNFTFNNVARGTYYVIAECSHCPTGIRVGPIGVQAAKTVVTVQLPETGINETVTVSANQIESLDEVTKTVDVIDGKEMRDRADFSLIDSLRTIPGFRVQQLGGFGRTANIKTRGLRNQDTAILIDGVRFRDPSSITGDATPFLSDITLTSVNRIEVLRGSGSSLYGTDAIGGTIDFQTPSPQAGFHGQIGGAFGGLGLGRFRGNVSDGTSDGRFGFNLGISRTVYTEGIDGQDNAHNTNFQSRIEIKPLKDTTVSARFFVSDAFVRLNSDPDTAGTVPASNSVTVKAKPNVNFVPDIDDPDSFQRSQFFSGVFAVDHAFSNELTGNTYYSAVRTSRKNDNGPLGSGFQSPSTSVFRGFISTFSGRMNWTPNKFNSVSGGYEYEWEKFANEGFTPDGTSNYSARAKQTSHSIYVQDLITLFDDRLRLVGSARAQFFQLKDPVFSAVTAPYQSLDLASPPAAYTFDGAVSYFFRSIGTKFRAHIGNGYRIPSLYERFGTFYNSFAFPDPRFEALGDPFLKPERTIAGDAGIEQSNFKDKIRFTAVYFHTKLLNTIGFGNVVPSIGATNRPFGGYLNTKGGIARGIEMSGRIRPTGSTDIFGSYTFTNSDQNNPQISGNPSLDTLGIPKHQFTLVATQRFKRFWINADLLVANSYLGSIFDTNAFTFRSYVYRFSGNRRMDVTAGYTIPLIKDSSSLRLFGTVENLFDYDYFENGFRTVGRTARIGLSYSF